MPTKSTQEPNEIIDYSFSSAGVQPCLLDDLNIGSSTLNKMIALKKDRHSKNDHTQKGSTSKNYSV